MTQTLTIAPGITLRCFPDHRFKHGCLSIQLLRPMCREEAALNALLPAVLLRGSCRHPDLRRITLRLDDLYGASVGALVRRVGDIQTTGFYASFTEDRFAMEGDAILEPMTRFLRELLLEPLTRDGVFCPDYVESEKKNLIATVEARLNDKRAYAMEQLLRSVCRNDSYGIPRLGEKADVEAITAQTLWDHYRRILRTSPIHIFYVGSAPAETVEALVRELVRGIEPNYVNQLTQTDLAPAPETDICREMDVNQGKLCMAFATPVTLRHGDFVAMQLLASVFGGGMTGKLFSHIREKLSLCYDISASYHGSKGILTVAAGIDSAMADTVRREILGQLDACCRGDITPEELNAARQSLRSGLMATHDSPGAIEGYYATAALSGLGLTPAEYIARADAVTVQQLRDLAQAIRLHSVFFLKGVGA